MEPRKTLHRLHWTSGIVLSVFFLVHIGNHLAALGGVEAHLQYMRTVRPWYRNPVSESLLLLAVILQIVSGIRLARQLRRRPKQAFEKWRVYSGLYLAFFLTAHTLAIFGFRHIGGIDTNFYFGVMGYILFPATIIFIPYYSLGIWSVFVHVACTHYYKIQHFGVSASRARLHAWIVIATGLLVTLLVLFAFRAAIRPEQVPAEYLKLAQ